MIDISSKLKEFVMIVQNLSPISQSESQILETTFVPATGPSPRSLRAFELSSPR